MITFSRALEIVKENALTPHSENIQLEFSPGRVLNTNIYADRDMPPFNKSAVDGFACKKGDLEMLSSGITEKGLRITETIPAGSKPLTMVTDGECSRIMTGAMLPYGADFVIMKEDVIESEGYIKLSSGNAPTGRGSNICLRGEDFKKGDLLIKSGTTIGASHIAVMASAGITMPEVGVAPVAGILSTGDEIVEPCALPEDYQIRDSNGVQLAVQAGRYCSKVNRYGIVKDNREDLALALSKAERECDIIILTGGVSMGDFDFVPEVLNNLGFKILFDKIAVQPGKPSTFAIKESPDGKKVVFALPGNPVSSYLQFELLVKPFIYKSMGGDYSPVKVTIRAAESYSRRNSERTAFFPVILNSDGTFSPVDYNGSAHILAMTVADGVASIPVGKGVINEGEFADVFILG
ncbi:MAG: molybdopterin molybdotransferase MoeA [Bacteroidales bacterium]